MDLLSAVKAGGAPVIIVDNLFAVPDLNEVGVGAKTDFLDAMEADAAVLEAVRMSLNAPNSTARELVDIALENAAPLWGKYVSAPSTNRHLMPLFGPIEAERAEIVRLRELVDHLTTFFGHAPLTFASLDDAKKSLSRCAIAFVDLFIEDGESTLGDMINLHATYRDDYRRGFDYDQSSWPKLVVLISTRMPDEIHLRSFRDGAGIRSAFFKGLNKDQISYDRVAGLLEAWSTKYANAAKLSNYLDDLSKIVRSSADHVIEDLDQIEVHDLAVLDAARLIADGSSLHSYVTWLTSELLAARTRTTAAAQTANAPERAFNGALDTVLVKESVLFDLFADVTSTPAEASGHPQFGEILADCRHLTREEITVYAAMSPACDLARCSSSFEVLLLRGVMKPSGRTAAELLQLGAVFGKGKHLMKYVVNGRQHQGVIKWETKTGLLTRPAGLLSNRKRFMRLGRMAELFAYEVKELAISQVSRIGLPVTPSVQRVGAVFVRVKFDLGKGKASLDIDVEAPKPPVICALLTSGRVGEDGESSVLMLTEQFRKWFEKEVIPLFTPGHGNSKVDALLKNLSTWSEWIIPLEEKRPFQELAIKVVKAKPEKRITGLEILIIPA